MMRKEILSRLQNEIFEDEVDGLAQGFDAPLDGGALHGSDPVVTVEHGCSPGIVLASQHLVLQSL